MKSKHVDLFISSAITKIKDYENELLSDGFFSSLKNAEFTKQ